MKQSEAKWYKTWFDTPYYHILYKNRDDKEAKNFMAKLTSFLDLEPKSHVLDVACGRGRHAVYLNRMGFHVTGIDLSQNNIDYAKQFENDNLKFVLHDMCQPIGNTYDAVLNLFTSFGYFEKDQYNINAIKAMKSNMKPHAYGVIDFLNVNKAIENLKKHETKSLQGIEFKIKKWVEDDYIFKKISFEDNDEEHNYIERLKCIDLELFKYYFKKAGVKIKYTFGNYGLDNFNPDSSDRLILIFQK